MCTNFICMFDRDDRVFAGTVIDFSRAPVGTIVGTRRGNSIPENSLDYRGVSSIPSNSGFSALSHRPLCPPLLPCRARDDEGAVASSCARHRPRPSARAREESATRIRGIVRRCKRERGATARTAHGRKSWARGRAGG
ncbi:hypothetical protein PUN28_013850 [Cardiocondyla obscurior]|uniref:Ribosomal protein L14 n=1 Tax=Cardiocondyla obscurior TaxID=286306 RepID=A0AAW2F6M8_9HYME